MKNIYLITILLLSVSTYGQSLKNFTIGEKFSRNSVFYEDETELNYINTEQTSVGNLRNVELYVIADKDSIIYKIGFYEANCDDEEMAKEYRLAVQKNYSIDFNSPKIKTETFNNAFTNYQNLTVTTYERICKVDEITYLLVTSKKVMQNPVDLNSKITFWQVSFFIINTKLEETQKKYLQQKQKENIDNNF